MENKHGHKKNKILFVTKKRLTSGGLPYAGGLSSGLANSVKFVVDMLNKNHIEAIHEDVIDGNCIDRVIHEHRPTHCIIEAIWVTPSKFIELKKLHKDVTFVVRVHSEIPFLSMEGMSMEWLLVYLEIGVKVGFNSKRTYEDFKALVYNKKDVLYMPNYYKVTKEPNPGAFNNSIINVGCFGAIRPFKNQLVQAVAAIEYAKLNGLKLAFHINTERVEGNGGPVLKNLRSTFNMMDHATLVEHPWLPHNEFIDLVKTMDIGLQMSYSETFNIVSADFINNNIPIVGSDEIEFLNSAYIAESNNTKDIIKKMGSAISGRRFNLQYLNKLLLKKQVKEAEKEWIKLYK